MRSTFKLLFYINRQKVRSDGTTAVLCRISIDGKNAVIATGVYLRPEEWHDAYPAADRTLSDFCGRAEKAYEQTLREQGVISAEILKNTLAGVYAQPESLLGVGEEEVERLRIRSAHIGSTSSYRLVKACQHHLRNFIRLQGMDDIPLSGVSIEFAESFRIFLKKDMGHSPSYTNRCLCWLSRLLYIALERGILRHNPLEDMVYEKRVAPSKPRHISLKELTWIMATPMPGESLELARRLFVFSCFTGLAFADVRRLTPQHIGQTSDGRMYIRKSRAKTDVEAFIPLHPVALQILSLYNTTQMEMPVFPLSGSTEIRNKIDLIGLAAGVKQSLSFHQARHSFATLSLSAGVPIESVSKMMGHSHITSTQIYAKVTEQKISEDMDRLMERRSRQKEKEEIIQFE